MITKLLCWLTAFASAEAFIANGHDRLSTATRAQAEATFGMGCFWYVVHLKSSCHQLAEAHLLFRKPSEELLKVDGVIDTVVGYTGNPSYTGPPPSYEAVCFSSGWVEGVRVVYDDELIDYAELLDAFFVAQEPKVGSRQYASIIFPHNEEQRQAAEEWRSSMDLVRSDGVTVAMTSIEPLSTFYQAEGYHQRYWQKTRPRIALIATLLAISTGVMDDSIGELATSVHTAANALSLAGMIGVLLERKLDTKVVKL